MLATKFPTATEGGNNRSCYGILLKPTFRAEFTHMCWEVIERGRAGVLRLDGPVGSLDLVVAYFPTGSGQATFTDNAGDARLNAAAERARLRIKIQAALRPAESCLSVVAGDFNWVADDSDRISMSSASESGARDRGEEQHWRRITTPFRLHELHQSEMTHCSSLARSRLDRVYWNQDLSEQLDRQLFCAVLPWQTGLSNHRAVIAGRRITEACGAEAASATIREDTIRSADWGYRVRLELQHRASDLQAGTPLENLRLVKEVMHQVSKNIDRDQRRGLIDAESKPDAISVTMRFIRAVERRSMASISSCLEAYPVLHTLVHNPYDAGLGESGGLARVREHVVELSRQFALQELQRLHSELPDLDEQEARNRRDNNLKLLARLVPGKTATLSAVMDCQGVAQVDPIGMAGALRHHWGNIFADKGMGQARARRWMAEEMEHSRADALPPSDSGAWVLRSSDFGHALKVSPSSSPGPDGVPFSAWRAIPDVAIPLLKAAYEQLAHAGDSQRIATDIGQFNESTVVFLHKEMSGPVALPSDTRPLSVANTDNRLIATACFVQNTCPLPTHRVEIRQSYPQ